MKLRKVIGIGALGLSLAAPAFAAQTQSSWYYLRLWPSTRTDCHYDDASAAPAPLPSAPFWCDDGSAPTPTPSKLFGSLNACNAALARDKFDNALTPYGGTIHDFGCFEIATPSVD